MYSQLFVPHAHVILLQPDSLRNAFLQLGQCRIFAWLMASSTEILPCVSTSFSTSSQLFIQVEEQLYVMVVSAHSCQLHKHSNDERQWNHL